MRFLISLFLIPFSLQLLAQEEHIEPMNTSRDNSDTRDLELKLDSKSGRYGYVDQKGEYIIKAQFRCASDFINGQALVSKKDKKCDPQSKKEKGWHFISENYDDKNYISRMPPRVEDRSKWYTTVKAVPKTK